MSGKPGHRVELDLKDKQELVERIRVQAGKLWGVRQRQRPGNEEKAFVNHLKCQIQKRGPTGKAGY